MARDERLAWVLVAVLVLSTLVGGCRPPESITRMVAAQTEGDDELMLSGALEAEEMVVSAESGGRVIELSAQEGDEVDQGEALVRLDATLLETSRAGAAARLDEAQAGREVAEAQLAQALAGARNEDLALAESRVQAARASLSVAQARHQAAQAQSQLASAGLLGAQARSGGAEANLAASQAQLAAAQAALNKAQAGATAEEIAMARHSVGAAENALWAKQAQRDAICGRVGVAVTQADCDAAKAAAFAAEEEVRVAKARLQQVTNGARAEDVAALQAGVDQAAAGVAGARSQRDAAAADVQAAGASQTAAAADAAAGQAGVELAQAQLAEAVAARSLVLAGARPEEIDQLQAKVAASRAAVAGARAALSTVEEQIARMTVVAPVDGIVLDCAVHEGELASAGLPLMTVADLSQLTLTVYVPGPQMGRVSHGQAVRINVDTHDTDFSGTVSYIASRAEFTPKNVDTREERVNKVYAVRIRVENEQGELLPGMPADAVFLADSEG